MNKDWKYILYLSVLATLLLSVLLGKDKQYDWTVTLAHTDRNPYGTFVLNELLPSIFVNEKTAHSNKTFYELKDSLKENEIFFLLAEGFNSDEADTKALLKYVDSGGSVLISANYISGKFADTLGIKTKDYFFEGINDFGNSNDTSTVHLKNQRFDTAQLFYYKRGNTHSYLTQADTSAKKIKELNPTVIALNDNGQPTTIRITLGRGQFIINSTPLIFTNIYLLDRDNHMLISSLLSYLPQKKMYWSEFYQQGRMEAATPLRFILTTEPLRWAYYIGIISILMFIVFEAKRKQRIIPVIKQLANTTLEFVSTIGNLYYESSDHKSIAVKKILFFNEAVRNKLNFSMNPHTANYAQLLSYKAGVDQKTVQQLVDIIQSILTQDKITSEQLTELNERINQFWKK